MLRFFMNRYGYKITPNEKNIHVHLYNPDEKRYYSIDKNQHSEEEFRKLLVLGHVDGGNIIGLAWMKDQGYSFDVKDKAGFTPLMIAIKRGYADIVEWLLKMDLNSQKVNKAESTDYDFAIECKQGKIANLILKSIRDKNPLPYLNAIVQFKKEEKPKSENPHRSGSPRPL